MKSFSKVLAVFFVLFSISTCFSQEDGYDADDSIEGGWNDDHYFNITLGAYTPIAFGDNFANRGLSHKTGLEINASVNIGTSRLLLGAHFSTSYADVTEASLVGNYDRSVISRGGPTIGWHVVRTPTWRAIIAAGGGYSRYKNFKDSILFYDSGNSFWINPSVQYHFEKAIGVYVSTSYTRDSTRIKVTEDFQDFFGSANYITITFGLSLLF